MSGCVRDIIILRNQICCCCRRRRQQRVGRQGLEGARSRDIRTLGAADGRSGEGPVPFGCHWYGAGQRELGLGLCRLTATMTDFRQPHRAFQGSNGFAVDLEAPTEAAEDLGVLERYRLSEFIRTQMGTYGPTQVSNGSQLFLLLTFVFVHSKQQLLDNYAKAGDIETLQSINERIQKLQERHLDDLDRLYDYQVQGYLQEQRDRYFSKDDSQYLPKGENNPTLKASYGKLEVTHTTFSSLECSVRLILFALTESLQGDTQGARLGGRMGRPDRSHPARLSEPDPAPAPETGRAGKEARGGPAQAGRAIPSLGIRMADDSQQGDPDQDRPVPDGTRP